MKYLKDEAALKTEIRKYLSARGAAWSNVTGGAYSRKGDSDILACYKGRFIAIEAKNPNGGGRLSDEQKVYGQMVIDAGGVFIVARSVEEVETCLNEIDQQEVKQ